MSPQPGGPDDEEWNAAGEAADESFAAALIAALTGDGDGARLVLPLEPEDVEGFWEELGADGKPQVPPRFVLKLRDPGNG